MGEVNFKKVYELRDEILCGYHIFHFNPCEKQNWTDRDSAKIMELIKASGVPGRSVIPFCNSAWNKPPLFEQAEKLFSEQIDRLLQLSELCEKHENRLSCLFSIWFYYPFIYSADTMRRLYVKIIDNGLFSDLNW